MNYIVIENNSGEDLRELKKNIIDFKLVESDRNLGMGGGNNFGIRIFREILS
jgi:GT2 family glycosyltransferase